MKNLFSLIGVASIIVVIFGTIYVALQQFERANADYPQVQIAQDAAAALNMGVVPKMVIGGTVNIRSSLAPFVIIYNKSGNAVAGSGYLHGSLPDVPIGALTAANGQEYHAVTWQPENGVRIAAVTVISNNYYVLSGRSLHLVEKDEDQTLRLVGIGCFLSLVLLLAVRSTRVSRS